MSIVPWVRRALVAAAVLAIALQWANTRITILRAKQFTAAPILLTTYDVFHDMAPGPKYGRLGQIDLVALGRHAALKNPWAPYERLPQGEHRWVDFYTLDIGYSFIVEAARLAFPSLPDNHLRSLALQVFVDAALLFFLFFVFSQWHTALGLLAPYLYASNGVFLNLVSFAYYYYWDIPFTFVVLGSLMLAYRRTDQARLWLTLTGLVLGVGVWVRASWWPLAVFFFALAGLTPRLRKHVVLAVGVFAVIAAPQVIRASWARGHFTLSTRAAWHVALVGLGYYPNPYGLQRDDGVIFKLTKDKYGVDFRLEDYWEHDQAAKKEFFSIWHKDPGFVIRSFLGRLGESVRGQTVTSVLSFLFMSNGTYRILCLLGLVAMIIRGEDKRLLGIAAAGAWAIYVVLTCLFYFVGLAYDNVSEVALLVMFIGGLESILYAVRRFVPRLGAIV